MVNIKRYCEIVNNFFNEMQINEIARETKFMKRLRKILPFEFLKSSMTMSLHGLPSLEELSSIFSKTGNIVSKQAIHTKVNSAGVAFSEKVLEGLISTIFECRTTAASIGDAIKHIIVVDSTRTGNARKKANVGKLQTVVDVLSKQIRSFKFTPENKNDQSYKDYLEFSDRGTLCISDLGYFSTKSLATIKQSSGLFLCRCSRRVGIKETSGAKVNLANLLEKSTSDVIDIEVNVGNEHKVSCRLIATKLNEEQQKKRDEHMERKLRRDSRWPKTRSELDNWNIFITNLPSTYSPRCCYNLYAMRWQIELMFKSMKSAGLKIEDGGITSLDKVMLHMKLIVLTLVTYIISISDGVEHISLNKALKRIHIELYELITKLGKWTLQRIVNVLEVLKKFARTSCNEGRPSTIQILRQVKFYA
jgi:hypothetical protein